MTIDLTGQTLASVVCDGPLQLTTSDGWHVTIENDYELRSSDGTSLSTASGEEELIVDLLTQAVDAPLTAFSYTDDGHLRLSVGGHEVRVAPDEGFESWNVVGPDQQRVVAMPGGELAVWS